MEIFSGRWSHRLIANATTDASGKAAVQLPADARIRLVTALKSGVGFDYDLFWREGDTHPWKEASDAVDLVLEGARTVTVKAVDSSGRPIPDVAIYPWIFRKDGKTVPEGPIAPDMQGQSASVNMSGSLAVRVKTDAQGIATFDWIPEMKASLQFNVSDHRYDSPYNRLPGELQDTSLWARARRAFEDVRDGVSSWANGATLTMRLLRTEAIRGRVTRPDGRPAAGVEVAADGVEVERLRMGWRFRNSARTADDGTYEILAFSNQVYAVAVVDDNGAAPTRFGVIVREGEPAEGVDFQLRRGTFIHGTLTQGPDRWLGSRSACWRPGNGREVFPIRMPGTITGWSAGRRMPMLADIIRSGSARERSRSRDHTRDRKDPTRLSLRMKTYSREIFICHNR